MTHFLITLPDASATLTDLERLRDLSPLGPDLLAAADVLITDARSYPPELPNQRYMRSGDLGDSWDRRLTSSGPTLVVVDIFNPTPYGPYVQGDDDQAAVHAGRWSTEAQLLTRNEEAMVDLVERGIDDIVEGRR